jgi:hypothetical protein
VGLVFDEHLVLGFLKFQNQETSGFGFLKNFKEPTGFVKDLAV